MKKLTWHIIIAICISAASCRKDAGPSTPTEESLFPARPSALVKGLYLLNEGNMNSNKATLDYVDFTTGTYSRNIYEAKNPAVTKGLGDVGNDIGVYGSKLYVVVNNSNKVEVLDAHSCKRITQVDLVNCRSICFANGKAYVSAYFGAVADSVEANGTVSEIDTGSLTITRQVTVGRQPEDLVAIGDALYVANSGGYSPPDYERTISVVDLNTFTETKRIDVAINLIRLKSDGAGRLYVISAGDYYEHPSDLFALDPANSEVVKDYATPASNFALDGTRLLLLSSGWNYAENKNVITYNTIDLAHHTAAGESFIHDGTAGDIQLPYGIAVNPESQEIFLTDAKDYLTPGTLYCFDENGIKKWSVTAGSIPAHFAFVH